MTTRLTTRQWQTLFGVAAAINAVLLAQDLHPQVIFPPWLNLVLLCISVALAVLRPGGDPPPGPPAP